MVNDIPIAVVGIAYRAPGTGGKGIWDYLTQARSAWSKFPDHRFNVSGYWKPGADKSGVFRAEGAHFVPEDIYAFDAAFFNMRAEEAKNADPQHRMLLECALEAVDDSGHSLTDLAGKKIGVFVGAGQHEYSERLCEDHFAAKTFTATGLAPCMLANRISYFFDVSGPSVVLDAACASSVYAAHQAVSAVRNGECEAAFIASCALTVAPGGWLALEKTGALSVHGRSFSYDHKASGFGRGEGAGCLLIKPLKDAVAAGDPIHAVIRNSACNHGGRSEGITMPNGIAHRELLRSVHHAVGLDPADTPVVEGHGTGTAAGDPIEAGAFTAVLAKDRTPDNPIYIGSVKSNFGHLEGASGMLGMIKAILMVKNGIVLPTAGFESINPKIPDKEKIVVAEAPLPWPKGEPRRVLVTNFAPSSGATKSHASLNGVDGTNGHTNGHTNGNINGNTNGSTNGTTNGHTNENGVSFTDDSRLFVLSAKSEKSLTSYLGVFSEYLEDEAPETQDYLQSLAYTLGQRRTHHPYRVAVVADSLETLEEKISAIKPGRAKNRTLAFAFTGQGAQYAQMATGLRRYDLFAAALDEADAHLRAMGATWSLQEELSNPVDSSRVDDAEISQPACTAIQLGLVALLKSWGLVPKAVTGHSSGEIAAAYAAGLISFKAAIAISYFRGQAAARLYRQQSQEGQQGAMLALGLGPEQAAELIQGTAQGYATVAAINSPKSVTVSGDVAAIERVHKAAEEQGLFARRLKIQMAYHSRHMESVASYYLDHIRPYCEKDAADLTTGDAADVMFVSSVTGGVLDRDSVDATYWVKNLVRPVRFADAIQAILTPPSLKGSIQAEVPNTILEIGPHAALKSPIKQTVELTHPQMVSTFTYLPSLMRNTSAEAALLDLAGALFTLGVPIQLGAINQTNIDNSDVITGLPGYAWDKSVSYQLEPRAVHEKLFPAEAYNPLLGRILPSYGGKAKAYRQVFTLDEAPWIRDHVVAGATIFPMTGYMSCAIEACRRTLSSPAAAFLVREFHVKSRLEIQEDEEVDMITQIRPAAGGRAANSSTAWEFEISAWRDNGWVVHAHGQIEPEFTDMSVETPTLKASLPLVERTDDLIEQDLAYAFAVAGVRATRYGPTFQNSTAFFEGKGYTLLEHKLRDLGYALEAPNPYGSPVSVDPPTIDGFLQGGGPLQVTEDGRRPAQMPNYISRFRISNTIPTTPGQRFDIVTRLLNYDVKGGRMNISVAAFARDADDNLTPVAEWESCAFRTIGSADEELDPTAALPESWKWELLPRFDYLQFDKLSKSLPRGGLSPEEEQHVANMDKVAWYYINKGIEETANDDRSDYPHHYTQFVKWANINGGTRRVELGVDLSQETLDAVRKHDAQGEMLCVIGEKIASILRGEVEPLALMLADGLLTRHYEADQMNAHLSSVLGELVLNLSNLEPNLKVLEIGAGTGGTTLPVLEALARGKEEATILNYTFTDISSGFFEGAKNKLSDPRFAHRITYKKLDIAQDPLEQGFDPDEYDVIIAANVLHATEDMGTTMTNVRKLLKPRGKLFLLEANRHPAVLLPFFLLPGWWYAKDHYRDHDAGPMMPKQVWNQLLLDTGFSGVDVEIQDRPGDPGATMSIHASTRVAAPEDGKTVAVTGPFMDDEEVEFATLVSEAIAAQYGIPVEIKPFAEIDPADDPYYIVIDSPRYSLMKDMNEEKFERLQNLLLRNTGLLWIIPNSGPVEVSFVKGMIRTLRVEKAGDPKNLMQLDETPLTEEALPSIVKLVGTLRDPDITRTQDMDFVFHDGTIYIPRMRLLRDFKEQFAAEQGIKHRKLRNLWEAGDSALEMTIDAAGSPDSIYFRRTDALQQQLGEDEIVVKVEAAGVSYRDLNLVLGAIPWAPPGFDGVGRVVKAGAGVTNLQEGDQVFFLSLESSAFCTYKKMPVWHAARVPARISTTDAATIPLAYSLAVLALLHTARLRKNETVLIHAAAGAVGQACVTIAQHLGADIFVSAGTPAKREFLHETFGIPKKRIFSSRTADFRDAILVATNNKGVDVIVNQLGAELMTETWAVTAPFGRFIEIGKKETSSNGYLPIRPFDSNVTFSGIDLRDLYRHRPDVLKDVFADVVGLVQRRVAVPIKPVTVLPISQFQKALQKLKSGDNIGKVVVTLGPDERVMAESNLGPTAVALKPDATYVITGGTRGIGLNLGTWMIDHGAKNVVLLGRSGAAGPAVKKVLKQYEGTDVTVRALACDVGNYSMLKDVLTKSIADLPPVKGVVHSALLLSDTLFENATFSDWEIICKPRVDAAWHLHNILPKDMDFFIGLGSFLGDTGNAGQAIYAGTAVFYHEFAKYRNKLGMHTISIALPVVLDVGYVADNNLTDILKQTLGATLTMADIRTLVKGAVMGPDSPFHHDGKALAFRMFLEGQPVVDGGPWTFFHPVHAKENLKAERAKKAKGGKGGGVGGAGGDVFSASWTTAEDPRVGLTEALRTKVSAMTIIDRDEVGADTPLATFNLDSLVSVELRNWIRRETGVEVLLSAITQAESLTALAAEILAQRQ
ncbi:putative polyketide synthase [Chaetomium fimeti]|uniref:Polyketide synthase n=1 Tax=Chaetomium fimeti TaxID=1854472 RepID=A0AAE0H6P3_9PEZI|nr:putative polyketide synthase [Chaetomium fimeti]